MRELWSLIRGRPMNSPPRRYAAMRTSPDPAVRRLAEAQLARLQRPQHVVTDRPAPWGAAVVVALFERLGNTVHARRGGFSDTGHEPVHGSKSGRCVLIFPEGRWWCRSCRKAGSVIDLALLLRGCPYRQAVAWLTTQYGPPATSNPTRQPRRGVITIG